MSDMSDLSRRRRSGLRAMLAPMTLPVLLPVLLSACFTSTSDFRENAEQFIAERVGPNLGTAFQSVACVAPVDQEVGTRFTCTALDVDGGVWEFDNEIDAPDEFTVTVSRRP